MNITNKTAIKHEKSETLVGFQVWIIQVEYT